LYRALLVGTLALLATASACGGDSAPSTSAPAGTATPGSGATAGSTQPARLSPAELGDAIFGRASEAIQKLVKLLDGRPAAAQVRPRVAELKEATVQELVKLGRQYETLNASDRALVDARVTTAYTQAANTDWYKAFAQTTTYYTTDDPELDKQIRSFNIITQYAFFELLKSQDPAEAQRLGIK